MARKKWRDKSMTVKILSIVGMIIAVLILWIVFDVVKGVLSKDAPRKPSSAGDTADYGYSGIQMAVWLIEHPDEEKKVHYYAQTEDPDDSLFAWRDVPASLTHTKLTEENLLQYIRPAADYMAKRYDCSDFRAIWLCKLRYALKGSAVYGYLLTDEVDGAIRDALTGFKYWITSDGADSMCYYSENHQMVFAVSEYYAGLAYPDAVFTVDGRTGREHAAIAKARMDSWFDQRGRYGFSEFLSSNYLAVDIGALSMLLSYCEDSALAVKAELALNMIFLDYALQMYDYGMTAPAGRNYARNNTNFLASTGSLSIVDKVWDTREAELWNVYSGFPALFISLYDSGRYEVPAAIVGLGRDDDKGVVKTSSGLTLKEMQEHDLIGLEDHQLMFQLGMGALSNREVIVNTLAAINTYDLVHNNFVSSFKFFNIKLLQLLGLTEPLCTALDPFSNGMAIQRNEVYTYCTEAYKLSTDQLYFPGSYGAQQLQQIACLPDRINVFTTNPMKSKEFQGYGVAPAAAQHENVMLSVYNIPEKKPLLATGDVRHYTSTYFPEEKFDQVTIDGNYAFGRAGDTFIAIIGASPLAYATYADQADFEKKIFDTYEFYEGAVGPFVDSYRLTDWTKGFDLRQQGDDQFTIYELSDAAHETYDDFMSRILSNRVEFTDNILTYATILPDGSDVTYCLAYPGADMASIVDGLSTADGALSAGGSSVIADSKLSSGGSSATDGLSQYVMGCFTVNGVPISTDHDRYDSRYVHTLRSDGVIRVEHGEYSYELDLTLMMK